MTTTGNTSTDGTGDLPVTVTPTTSFLNDTYEDSELEALKGKYADGLEELKGLQYEAIDFNDEEEVPSNDPAEEQRKAEEKKQEEALIQAAAQEFYNKDFVDLSGDEKSALETKLQAAAGDDGKFTEEEWQQLQVQASGSDQVAQAYYGKDYSELEDSEKQTVDDLVERAKGDDGIITDDEINELVTAIKSVGDDANGNPDVEAIKQSLTDNGVFEDSTKVASTEAQTAIKDDIATTLYGEGTTYDTLTDTQKAEVDGLITSASGDDGALSNLELAQLNEAIVEAKEEANKNGGNGIVTVDNIKTALTTVQTSVTEVDSGDDSGGNTGGNTGDDSGVYKPAQTV